MPRPRRLRSAMRAPLNSAASTAVCLARRRYAISRPYVTWLVVRESRGACASIQNPTIDTCAVHDEEANAGLRPHQGRQGWRGMFDMQYRKTCAIGAIYKCRMWFLET